MKDKFTPGSERRVLEVGSNAERSKILSPLCGSTILDQHSTRHPKVFVKTFGWPLSTL